MRRPRDRRGPVPAGLNQTAVGPDAKAHEQPPTVRWLPFVVLALSLLLTAVTTYHALTTADARDRLRFENLVDKIQPILQNRMEIYIALVRATAGLFAAEGEVDAARFHDFVSRLKLAQHYPGVQAIGFTTSHGILYLEPADPRHQAAVGFDMSADPVRRAAMERARDSGATTLSGRVPLLEEPRRTGFLIFSPVYRRGAPAATPSARRAALLGFAYSPFLAENLFRGLLGPDTDQTVALEVFSGPRPEAASSIYRSHNSDGSRTPAFTRLTRLELANAVWTLRFASLPGFTAASSRDQAMLLLLLGLFTSAILFLVTRSEERARFAAERVAADLRRSQEELRAERERYRRLAEAEHRARGEAETASQAKDRFLATLSHELRTPLAPVLAVISNLEAKGGLSAGCREGLGVIRRNVELEARLIDDLLDLTRISQNKLELRPEVADLEEILAHALDACCPPGTSLRARFTVAADAGDYRLWGDAARLTQVFWNLFKNALKFSQDDSPILVRAAAAPAGRLTVEVTDVGIGIEPERLEHVFEAFEQGQRAITRRYGGLGLGLTISKSIVELHGGCLTVASEGPGRGCTFTVELPTGPLGEAPVPRREPGAGEIERVESAAAAELSPLHILLVEDHADTADAMATLLAILGHDVTVAGNAEQAIEALEDTERQGRRIDLLISDVGLPAMSGLELMRELRRRCVLPGIALSGYGMDEDVERSLKAGFALHLTKPVSLPHLKAAIAMVTTGSGRQARGA